MGTQTGSEFIAARRLGPELRPAGVLIIWVITYIVSHTHTEEVHPQLDGP